MLTFSTLLLSLGSPPCVHMHSALCVGYKGPKGATKQPNDHDVNDELFTFKMKHN